MPPAPKSNAPSGAPASPDGTLTICAGMAAMVVAWIAGTLGFGKVWLMRLGDWIGAGVRHFFPRLPYATDQQAMAWGSLGFAFAVALATAAFLWITSKSRLAKKDAKVMIAAEQRGDRARKEFARRTKKPSPSADNPSDRLRAERDDFIRRKKEGDHGA